MTSDSLHRQSRRRADADQAQTSSRIRARSSAAAASPASRRERGEPDLHVQRHAAVAQHDDPVGERERFRDVVGDQDGGEAVLVPDALQQPVHLAAGQRVERAERLVEQQDARVADERAREGDALALAAREHGRPVVGAVGEPDVVERRRRRLAPAVGCGRCRRCRSPAAREAAGHPGTAAGRSAAAPRPVRSPTTILPSVARSRPAISRRSVVLPQPERPTIATNSPAGMVEIDAREHAPVAEGLGQADR